MHIGRSLYPKVYCAVINRLRQSDFRTLRGDITRKKSVLDNVCTGVHVYHFH